jgi:hypothetical protein
VGSARELSLHRNLIEDMEQERNASQDNVLESLATAVENNPSDIFAWRRLVRALGPAGMAVSSRQRKECKRSSCVECSRLRKGLNIDHVALRDSRQSHCGEKDALRGGQTTSLPLKAESPRTPPRMKYMG